MIKYNDSHKLVNNVKLTVYGREFQTLIVLTGLKLILCWLSSSRAAEQNLLQIEELFPMVPRFIILLVSLIKVHFIQFATKICFNCYKEVTKVFSI